MAWSFIGTSATVEATATPLTLTEPAGVAAGDLLIATISSRSSATTAPTISGWTAVGSQNNNNILSTTSALASGAMLYRIRGTGAPTLAVTLPATVSVAQGRITAYRGCNQGSPLDVTTAVTTAIATTAVSVTGMTTTATDDLIVALAAGGQEATWASFKSANAPTTASGAVDTTTAPSTTAWIKRAETVTTTGVDTSIGVFDAVKTATGATGNFTTTASQSAGHVVIAGAFRIAQQTADAWNDADITLGMSLSNVDKTATATGAGIYVRSTKQWANQTTGKYYSEFKVEVRTSTSGVGLHPLSSAVGSLTNSAEVLLSGAVIRVNGSTTGLTVGGSSVSAGDVISMAWDAGAEKIWFRNNAGLWNNDAGADPATGTNGLDISASIGAVNAACFFRGAASGDSITLRTELAEFTQSVPSGFTSWMGETPLVNRTVTADAGSYAITGADATLTKAGGAVSTYTLPAAAGSYALTGATAGLTLGREVLAVGGAYALSGAATSLEYGREAAADAGSYALSGADVVLRHGWKTATLSGSYALTGTVATLRRTYAPVAVSGSYSLTGQTVTLTKAVNKVVVAAAGSYSLTGSAATLLHGWKTAAVGGSYALTGTVTSLERGRMVAATAGSYALTGTTANFRRTWLATAVAGSYSLSGTAATFRRTYNVTAVSGSYALTGVPVNLLKPGAYAIIGLPGSYALTGAASTLIKTTNRSLAAVSGAYALGGATATLKHAYRPVAISGLYALSGAPATLSKTAARTLVAVPGSYALTGTPSTLTWSGAAHPPVYRSIASTTYASRTDSTVCNAPAGLVNGDVLLAGAFAGKAGTDIGNAATIGMTPPADWTEVGAGTEVFAGGFAGTFHVYWKRAAGEGSTYTFTHNGGASTQVAIAAYSNCVTTGNPVDVFSQNSASTGATATGLSVYATSTLTELVYLGHNWDATGALTPPLGETERFDNLVYLSDEDKLPAGRTGDRTQALASSNPWSAFLVALKSTASVVVAAVDALPGSYALSGADVVLEKSTRNVVSARSGLYNITGSPAIISRGLFVAGGSYVLSGSPAILLYSGAVVIPPGSGQREGDGGRAGVGKRKRAKIFYIITQKAKKVVERPMPLRKKRKKLAKVIAEEVLGPAGGLLTADKLLLELMIRRQLEQIPLTDLHTEGWYQLQDQLLEVITDAEQTAQLLRAEAEEEDDLLLLLTS